MEFESLAVDMFTGYDFFFLKNFLYHSVSSLQLSLQFWSFEVLLWDFLKAGHRSGKIFLF